MRAWRAHVESRPDADAALDRLDAVLRGGGRPGHELQHYNIALARILDERGRLGDALRAIRRREYHEQRGVNALSTFLREEGGLAARSGDRQSAIEAWTHYLVLRADPEPGLRAQRDSVRAELARLLAE